MTVEDHSSHEHAGPGYASPQAAREQPPEQFVYVASLYEGTGIDRPDFIAVVDVDPSSSSYGQIVHRTEMPNVGDELHHFGWNACSSACHSQLSRDTLIVPGFRSSRIHMLDISDPRMPRIKNVIEGEEIKEKLGLSAPHTVHCMPGDIVTISMLGDADGNAPGGFAVLDARDFTVAERWEREPNGLQFMYDFWYQPRQNARLERMGSSEHVPGRVQPGRCRRREVRTPAALLGSRAAGERPDRGPGRRRPHPAGDPLAARS
jgi:selenium-binding protein 1